MTDTPDAVAAYLAKGGKVAKIDTGVRSVDDRTMYKAIRGENELIAERHIVSSDHLGRDIVCNGLGEIIGYA